MFRVVPQGIVLGEQPSLRPATQYVEGAGGAGVLAGVDNPGARECSSILQDLEILFQHPRCPPLPAVGATEDLGPRVDQLGVGEERRIAPRLVTPARMGGGE